MSVCIVCSGGGHLREVRQLRSAYEDQECFYVLNNRVPLPADMEGRTIFLTTSGRNWKFFLNCFETFAILLRRRPKVILSTGASPAVPFFLLGRYLFGATTIFLETVTKIDKPTVTARMLYPFASHFFYQWPGQKTYFPKGRYLGTAL